MPGTPHAAQRGEALQVLERELTLLLRRSRAVQGRLGSRLHSGLDGAVYAVLLLLDDAGPLRASDLVVRLGMDKSTVSRQVAALVDLGLVERTADPLDGRARALAITAEGHRRLGDLRAERRARWQADLADWDPADVAALASLLDRVNRLREVHEAELAGD